MRIKINKVAIARSLWPHLGEGRKRLVLISASTPFSVPKVVADVLVFVVGEQNSA